MPFRSTQALEVTTNPRASQPRPPVADSVSRSYWPGRHCRWQPCATVKPPPTPSAGAVEVGATGPRVTPRGPAALAAGPAAAPAVVAKALAPALRRRHH